MRRKTWVSVFVQALIFFGIFLSPLPGSAAADNIFVDLLSGTKIYYSHVAVTGDGWETEIAILNPNDQPALATLKGYDENGNNIGLPMFVRLNPHGRYECLVGETFNRPREIAYLVLTSSEPGLKGYTKFYFGSGETAIRASIMGSVPRKHGIFSKIDHQGWTGIAFVNAGSATAHITLTAYNDSGTVIAVAPMSVLKGQKKVDVAQNFFNSPIDTASHIEFTSDQPVAGFFLNGNPSMLDGSQAQ